MKALVIGSASCVWQDLKATWELFQPDLVVAVNMMGLELENITDWASMHGDKLLDWASQRTAKGWKAPRLWAAHHNAPAGAVGLNLMTNREWGSSGLLGVRVAQHLGAKKIVLAGVPLERSPHFNTERSWGEAEAYRRGWLRDQAALRRDVRSMSGWTRYLLGYPTDEWLRKTG